MLLMGGFVLLAGYQIYRGVKPGGMGGTGGKGASKKGSGSNNWFGGGGNMMGNMQQSKVAVYGEDKKIDIRFKDVAGNENAK